MINRLTLPSITVEILVVGGLLFVLFGCCGLTIVGIVHISIVIEAGKKVRSWETSDRIIKYRLPSCDTLTF